MLKKAGQIFSKEKLTAGRANGRLEVGSLVVASAEVCRDSGPRFEFGISSTVKLTGGKVFHVIHYYFLSNKTSEKNLKISYLL